MGCQRESYITGERITLLTCSFYGFCYPRLVFPSQMSLWRPSNQSLRPTGSTYERLGPYITLTVLGTVYCNRMQTDSLCICASDAGLSCQNIRMQGNCSDAIFPSTDLRNDDLGLIRVLSGGLSVLLCVAKHSAVRLSSGRVLPQDIAGLSFSSCGCHAGGFWKVWICCYLPQVMRKLLCNPIAPLCRSTRVVEDERLSHLTHLHRPQAT